MTHATQPSTPGTTDAAPDEDGTARAVAAHPSLADDRPETLLRWAIQAMGDKLVLVTSFQAEGMVLLDMAWHIDPSIRVVTLDTGRLPQETHELIDRVQRHYGLEIEVHAPDPVAIHRLVSVQGPNLFYRSREGRLACCHARKVAPLRIALEGVSAWITGLRREQSASRATLERITIDQEHDGRLKLSPLADWRWSQVWTYIRRHGVPYHRLYDRGYTSIGCAPCTRPVGPGEDARAGRWWWEAGGAKECGLHLAPREDTTSGLLPVVPS